MIERPEEQFLIDCAGLPMHPAKIAHARTLIDAGLDWDYLTRTAETHNLTPILAKQIEHHFADAVPPAIRQKLGAAIEQSTYWNLWQAGELHRLLELFNRAGVPVVPHKGLWLAQVAYGGWAWRRITDLDLLICARDFWRAQKILLAEGYAAYPQLSERQTQAYVQYRHELTFQHSANRFIVDLHWGVWFARTILWFERMRFWDRLRPVKIAGKMVTGLAAEDALLLLAMHGLVHYWSSLNWGVDIAQLIRAHPNTFDWTLTLREAERLGVMRVLFIALKLAQELIAFDLPADVAARVDRDEVAGALAERFRAGWFQPPQPMSGWDELALGVQARERWRDKLHCVLTILTSPTTEEIQRWPLPKPLFPFYRILRPLRLTLERESVQ
jgi:hypothetical protein